MTRGKKTKKKTWAVMSPTSEMAPLVMVFVSSGRVSSSIVYRAHSPVGAAVNLRRLMAVIFSPNVGFRAFGLKLSVLTIRNG